MNRHTASVMKIVLSAICASLFCISCNFTGLAGETGDEVEHETTEEDEGTITNSLINNTTASPILFNNSAISYSISATLNITSTSEVVFGPDVTIEVNKPIKIMDGGSLKILEGTTLLFATGAYISVGETGSGTLNAIGTASDSVIFKRLSSTGNWGSAGGGTSKYYSGIRFFSGATDACSLLYCSIENAYRGILASDAKIAVSHSTISNNSENGCCFLGQGAPVDSAHFTQNAIHDNGVFGISIAADFIGSISSSCTIYDNAEGGVFITADKVEQDALWHTFDDPYVLNGTVEVASDDGVTVIISAGATFLMGTSAHLKVGASLKPGTLIANGTESDSITFTSLTNTTNWGPGSTQAKQIGFLFTADASPSCSLTYCILNRANNAVVVNSTRITISNSRISNSKRTGVKFNEDASPADSNAFADNIITGNGHYGVEIYANHVGKLSGTGSVAGNTTGSICILGDKVEEDAVWKKRDAAYVVSGRVSIGGADMVTLTIEQGTAFLMQGYFDVGGDGGAGTLIAKGTADDHIKFASFTSEYWGTDGTAYRSGAINIRGTAGENTSFTYCDIRNATTGFRIFDIEPTVTNCSIANCRYYGITLEGATGTNINENTFSGNGLEDINME